MALMCAKLRDCAGCERISILAHNAAHEWHTYSLCTFIIWTHASNVSRMKKWMSAFFLSLPLCAKYQIHDKEWNFRARHARPNVIKTNFKYTHKMWKIFVKNSRQQPEPKPEQRQWHRDRHQNFLTNAKVMWRACYHGDGGKWTKGGCCTNLIQLASW